MPNERPHRQRPSFACRYVAAALGWWLGLAWQMQQPSLWPPALSWGMFVVAALAGVWAWRRAFDFLSSLASLRSLRSLRSLAVTCVVFTVTTATAGIAATALAHGWAAYRLNDSLSPALEGQDVLITGVVAELPRISPLGSQFLFEVESAPPGVPSKLSLGAFQSEGEDGAWGGTGGAFAFVAGDRWRMTVRLKRPHGLMNPHGFDLELWMFEQGIGATGTVRPGAQRLQQAVAHPIGRARQRVRDALLQRVSDRATAGVLAALAIGDQAAILREDWDLFRVTGVAHLMSISGLHVTMFAWLASMVVGWLWQQAARSAAPWVVRWPAPTVRRWGGWMCATAYAFLAGWGVPAQRTVLMIGTTVVLRSMGLRWPQPLIVLNAGLWVTLLDPWAQIGRAHV